jgi:hypothetical protein
MRSQRNEQLIDIAGHVSMVGQQVGPETGSDHQML